jgi:hypothetical protein
MGSLCNAAISLVELVRARLFSCGAQAKRAAALRTGEPSPLFPPPAASKLASNRKALAGV